MANLDQILCVASWGWRKGCIRFWGRLDQNSGFHGSRKPPLTYNGESDVSTFSQLFLIRSFLYLQVTRTCIKSWMSSNFGQIRPLITESAKSKNFPIDLLWENGVSMLAHSVLMIDRIITKVAGNKDRHKSLDKFDFGPLVSMAHLYVFLNEIDLGTLDSGERSLPFGLLVFCFFLPYSNEHLNLMAVSCSITFLFRNIRIQR